MQVVHTIELGIPGGIAALYILDGDLCGLFIMNSVEIQMQCHCDGCNRHVIGILHGSLGGRSLNCRSSFGSSLRSLGSGDSAYNGTQSLKDEDEHDEQDDDHAESNSGDQPCKSIYY